MIERKPKPADKDTGTSPVLGTIIIVALTLILIILLFLLLMSLLPNFSALLSQINPDEYFIVTLVDYDSAMLRIQNIGDTVINSAYSAVIFINGVKRDDIAIATLNAHEFIPTSHYGVHLLYGPGPTGTEWKSKQYGFLDLSNGFLKPGDVLRIDIISKDDSRVYSSTTYTCP